jgi:hypothetical protein
MAARAPMASAVDLLDRSLVAVRQGGAGILLPAWAGGAVLALVALASYHLDVVEGVRDLRPVLGGALALAWVARALLITRATRRALRVLWPGIDHRPASTWGLVGAACVVGLGLWLWLWIPAIASLGGVWPVLAVMPLLAVRGGVAPSWIARLDCEPEGGVRAFRRAFGDTAGMRLQGMMCEALVLLGLLAVLANAYVLVSFVSSLGWSLAGFDPTVVTLFLSEDNTFVWLLMGAGTLVVAEPLRASLSAVAYLEHRFRHRGMDLEAAVDAAVAGSRDGGGPRAAGPGGAAAIALVLVACVAATPTSALAQQSAQEVDGSSPGLTEADVRVRATVEELLGRSEFRELPEARTVSLDAFWERLLAWLRSMLETDLPDEPSRLELPAPPAELLLALAAILLAIVLVYVGVQRTRDRRADEDPEESLATEDPREQAPSEHLAEAKRLAAEGRHRDGLRALYLATLVALDRRGMIAFDPARTNWQYLRQLPPGPARHSFGSFTRLFDHKWYGDEPTSAEDFERGHALASDLCAPPETA